MQKDKRKSIVEKVKALLRKTPESGATEEEAKSAFILANKLIEDWNIQDGDLSDKEIVAKSSKFKLNNLEETLLCVPIAEIFSCFGGKNGIKQVVFVGTKQDVELCIFYYEYIYQQLQESLVNFKKTLTYKRSEKKRTSTNSFRRGYCFTVGNRLRKMYKELKQNESNEYGLILASKSEKIREHVGETGSVKTSTPKNEDREALMSGVTEGNEVKINKPIC